MKIIPEPSHGVRLFRRGRPINPGAPKAMPPPMATTLTGVIIYGQTVTLVDQTERFDGYAGGIQTVSQYKGTPAEIAALREACLLNGTRYEFARGVPDMIAIYSNDVITGDPTTENPYVTETWDLDFSEATGRLSVAPLFNVDDATALAVKKTEKAIDDGSVNGVAIDIFAYNFQTAFGLAACNTYRDYRLVTWGDTYPISEPILIQRISQATTGQARASLAGVNTIWKVNPNSTLNKLGDLTGYQWLKKPARKTLIGGRVSLEQRYLGRTTYPAALFT